jgi:hypothetical protein
MPRITEKMGNNPTYALKCPQSKIQSSHLIRSTRRQFLVLSLELIVCAETSDSYVTVWNTVK